MVGTRSLSSGAHSRHPVALLTLQNQTVVFRSRSLRNLENQTRRRRMREQPAFASVMRASAVAARRPTLSILPSLRTGPVSLVMPLMKETLNSSVV